MDQNESSKGTEMNQNQWAECAKISKINEIK